jgi:hypothetical protein
MPKRSGRKGRSGGRKPVRDDDSGAQVKRSGPQPWDVPLPFPPHDHGNKEGDGAKLAPEEADFIGELKRQWGQRDA